MVHRFPHPRVLVFCHRLVVPTVAHPVLPSLHAWDSHHVLLVIHTSLYAYNRFFAIHYLAFFWLGPLSEMTAEAEPLQQLGDMHIAVERVSHGRKDWMCIRCIGIQAFGKHDRENQ